MLTKYFENRKFAALLFDFDGTIADTMPSHFESWKEVLSEYNVTFTREQHLGWAGRPTREIVRLLNELHLTNMTYEAISKAKESHYMQIIKSVKEITSVAEIIRHYHGELPMAVVSGSRRKVVEATMQHLGITKYFDALVCSEDYVNGKPDPECFLKAASILKVNPKDCLVFEDAELGIQAGQAAGMTCLRVTHDHALEVI